MTNPFTKFSILDPALEQQQIADALGAGGGGSGAAGATGATGPTGPAGATGADGSGGGGSLLSVQVDISQSELTTLHSSPKLIIAGTSNKIIAPVMALMQYVGSVLPSVFNPDIGTHVSSVFKRWGVVWNSILTGSYAAITGPENTWPLASIAGQDLVLYGASDMGIYGPITALAVTAGQGGGQYVVNDTFSVSNSLPSSGGTGTIASVNAGGTGYLAGDTGTINGGTGDATYTVSTVDGNGAVLTFTFTGGTTYTTATNVGTTDGGDQGGSGIGFTVDIVAASGPISAAVLSLTGGTASTVTVTNAGDLYMTTVGIGTTATTGIGNGLEVDTTVSTPSTGTARIKMYYTLEDEFTG